MLGRGPTETTDWSSSESTRRSSRSNTRSTASGRRSRSEGSTTQSRSTATTRSGRRSTTTTGRRCTSSTGRESSATDSSAKAATRNPSASSSSCSVSSASSSPSKGSASRRRPTGTTCGTPETYLGYGRSERFASPDGTPFDRRHGFELPKSLDVNHWGSPATGRSGVRTSCSTRPAAASPIGSTRATFISCCLPEHETRSPSRYASMVRLRDASAGVDVDEDGSGVLRDGRLYQLIRQHDGVRDERPRSPSASPAPRRTRSHLASDRCHPALAEPPATVAPCRSRGRSTTPTQGATLWPSLPQTRALPFVI